MGVFSAVVVITVGCVVGSVVETHLMNNLIHDPELPSCSSFLRGASHHPARTAHMPPDLRGKWVSTRCESRPGPQYVLRSYSFHRDKSFNLALHIYRDAHCAHPAHTLAAQGTFSVGRPSWVTLGGNEADYTLTRVDVVAHTHRDAALVSTIVNTTCPGKVIKPWKPHKAYTVLAYTETTNDVTEDEDCSRDLGGAWHELQLMRVEEIRKTTVQKDGKKGRSSSLSSFTSSHSSSLSPSSSSSTSSSSSSSSSSTSLIRRELFLGDLHTDVSKQDLYRPTGYQTPLLNIKYAVDCGVCSAVGRSSERNPAHLHAGPALPLLLAGSWASHRCETQPYGMFLTRKLDFSHNGGGWSMTLRHYHDPDCSRPSFTLAAMGSYTQVTPSPYAHDFTVTRLILTPEDPDLASALNLYKGKDCGLPGTWVTREPQDVTPTGGCQVVGVKVPAVDQEILRAGVDESGNMWITLGQTATAPRQVGETPRPTSWGPPLFRCQHFGAYDEDNSLQPMAGARVSWAPACASSSPIAIAVFALVVLLGQ